MGTSSEVLSYEWRCFCQIEKNALSLSAKSNQSLFLHLPVPNTGTKDKISDPSLINHPLNRQYRTTKQMYMWTVPIKTLRQWRFVNSLRNSYL